MRQNKRYNVVARNRRVLRDGLTTGLGHRSFQGKSQMVISDPAEAREIAQRFKRDVSVIEDDRLGFHMDHDRQTDGHNSAIHHYTFQMPSNMKIRTTRDNGYVWARVDGRQVRMLRSQALEEGYEIVEKK